MKTKFARFLAGSCVVLAAAGALARPATVRAGTYTVNTVEDLDDGSCDARHCSLREAINRANANAGPDTIEFSIPGPGPHVIRLNSPLSELLDDGTTIAGDSQPGYTVDLTYPSGLRARGRPKIIIDGSLMTRFHGLLARSNSNVIRGLSWIDFSGHFTSFALVIEGNNNSVEANFFGLSPDGAVHANILGLSMGGDGNFVLDNVISGNDVGIQIWDGRQEIQGNLIGTDPTGARAVRDSSRIGILIGMDAENTLIGGSATEERNVISGFAPAGTGIEVSSMRGVSILNNYIGTNAAGDTVVGNWSGIHTGVYRCDDDPSGDAFCTWGTPVNIMNNVISGNTYGIRADMDFSVIRGNRIGTNAAGTAALGPQGYGIYSESGRRLLIGGYGLNEGNLISGNGIGLSLEGDAGSAQIYGNKIGTNLAGNAAIVNEIGVLSKTYLNTIGSEYAGNQISGNTIGLWIEGESNAVQYNRFGTDSAGGAPVPNSEGIRAVGIQRELQIRFNLIAFNTTYGIFLENSNHVLVFENTIHHNGRDGIYLDIWGSEASANNRFLENSTHHNGGLGIRFQSSAINDGIEPPTITATSPGWVEGEACAGCRIEVFLTDHDPSGYGEGKTFLAYTDVRPDGTFHADFSRITGLCDTVTATVTDTRLNTSTFSRAANIGICVTPSPLMIWVWIISWGAGGGVLFALIFSFLRSRRPVGRSPIVPGLLGGAVGAGIAVAFLALPIVHIDWPQAGTAGQAPSAPPPCGQFLDPSKLQPENGVIFGPGTDVLFELSPQPDPPGMTTRWFLEVSGPNLETVSKELTSNSIHLSELGFDPQQTGVYFWTLKAERAPAGSNAWTPLCVDSVKRMFRIAAPLPAQSPDLPQVTPTETTTATATPTGTLAPSAPTATLRTSSNCRRGAGADYSVVTTLPQGSVVPIVGRNPEGGWWQVQVPGTQTQCWIAGENADTSGDTSGVPVVQSPPLGCWVWTGNKNECQVPCPEGAQPGGACEP